MTKPNRMRSRSTGRNEAQRKQSGDQHILPIDELVEDARNPHRISRQDMQKTVPGGTGKQGKSGRSK
jgi:hypothetical protein